MRLSARTAAFPTWRPFYGVKSVAFYSDPNGFSRKHLHMARSAFDAIGASGIAGCRDAAMINGVGGRLTVTPVLEHMTSDPISSLGCGRCAGAHGEARDLRGDEARVQAAAREDPQQRHRVRRTLSARQLRRMSWFRVARAEAGARDWRSEEARRHLSRRMGRRARHRARRLGLGSDHRRSLALGSRLRGPTGFRSCGGCSRSSAFRPSVSVVVTRRRASPWYSDITTNAVGAVRPDVAGRIRRRATRSAAPRIAGR